MARERIWSWVNCTLLVGFALLLSLKLTGMIDWSWWLVCSPLLLIVVILIVAFAIMGYFFPQLLESNAVQQSCTSAAWLASVQSLASCPLF